MDGKKCTNRQKWNQNEFEISMKAKERNEKIQEQRKEY